MTDLRAAYVDAADTVLELLARAEVALAWDRPSALPEWSVGGLAGHLAGQVFSARDLVARPPAEVAPIPLPEHYARAAWVTAGVDDEVNVGIREGGDAQATEGPAALLARTRDARAEVAARLVGESGDRPVLIPWQGWALRLDDFLVTRMMEIAVHSDDLAVSVGIDAPELGPQVLEPVLALLTTVSVRRHGQAAVLRALSRRERAPESITAF